jgi:uncharacterized protein (TIGR02001 family)
MNHATRCTAAVVLCAALLAPFAASAQDEAESPFSWNVTGVSDYVFRGVSQTDEDPTLQVGFTYTSPVGLYAGVWGSGVDFGDGGPDAEVDYFIGYGVDITDSLNFDVMLNHYSYPGSSDLAYTELITKTSFAEHYNVTVATPMTSGTPTPTAGTSRPAPNGRCRRTSTSPPTWAVARSRTASPRITPTGTSA